MKILNRLLDKHNEYGRGWTRAETGRLQRERRGLEETAGDIKAGCQWPLKGAASETAVQERNKTAAHVNTVKLLNVTLEGSQNKCSVFEEKQLRQYGKKPQNNKV